MSDLVWSSSPVSEAPFVVLVGWRVFEFQLPDRADRTRHFCGTKALDGRGEASTAIVQFNPSDISGFTESGRQYILINSPGLDANADVVWDAFVRVNHAQDVVDMTAEVRTAMEAA